MNKESEYIKSIVGVSGLIAAMTDKQYSSFLKCRLKEYIAGQISFVCLRAITDICSTIRKGKV